MKGGVLILALLAGCATMTDVENARNSWQGARYDEVVARWGAPNREATLADGRKASTWVAEGGYGGTPASVGVFGGSGGGGIGVSIGLPGMGMGSSEPQRCERTLIFKGGVVVEQTWLGNPALCRTFSRN
ncbi:MAG: hypothetical protein A3I02_13590 [Betaproteobacteria bacterium RIFCSPLOWO2_02_FULL_67_26]|nr:MAG: hypothetical protein A3I02_13590 [Betaproteobacteria bacterium RIFCSPLOWO2_02_FULL_67_26]